MNEYKVSLEQEGKRLDVFLTDVMEGSRSYPEPYQIWSCFGKRQGW